MVRRRLTLKRVDPWSTLKFGFIANLSLLAIWMLGAGVMWFFVQRLQLIDKVCSIATDMGFIECGINGGNLFRALFLLGLLGVVINTGLVVFLAFLHNLIADLVGGLTFSFVDDTPGAAARGEVSRTAGSANTGAATTAQAGAVPVGAGGAPSARSTPGASGDRAATSRPPGAGQWSASQQPSGSGRPSGSGAPSAPPSGSGAPSAPPSGSGAPSAPPGQNPPTGSGRPASGGTTGAGTPQGRPSEEDRVFGDRSREQSTTRIEPDRGGSEER